VAEGDGHRGRFRRRYVEVSFVLPSAFKVEHAVPAGKLGVSGYAAVKNVFNRTNPLTVNRIVMTDLVGVPPSVIPDTLPPTTISSGRRLELGLSVAF
jgi:hypothetical protein